MFFRRPAPKQTRADAWRVLAGRLGLLDASDAERMLRTLLNLDKRVRFGPIYFLTLGEGERLLMFDYEEPVGGLPYTTSACLITTRTPFGKVSFKASRKPHAVLESLGASAAGGAPVQVPDDPAFNEAVTVYARDEAEVQKLLTPEVRALLRRTLCTREAAPTLRLGERHLFLSARARREVPVKLDVLEAFSGDLLSLYAALKPVQNQA